MMCCLSKTKNARISTAAVTSGTAARAATAIGVGTELHAGAYLKTIAEKINFNRLCFFIKIFFHDKLNSIDIVNVIRVLRLIQSHCQRGAASAALVQKDPDRRNFLAVKIFSYLLISCFCNFNHDIYPP